MERKKTTPRVLAMAAALSCVGAGASSGPPGLGASVIDGAFARGASCLVRDLDASGSFKDPYLAYVYPGEALPVPPGAQPLTYRQVDADVVLALIGRAGRAGETLGPVARAAEEALRRAAALWRGRGFWNTARDARPDGVALDTACIVGWLQRDDAAAAEAAAAIEGDRWLRPRWYDDAESYRSAADESWCLRLLAATGRFDAKAEAVLERLGAELRDHRRAEPGGAAAFYEAWHIAMVIAELRQPARWAKLGHEAAGVLRGWADARPPSGPGAPTDGGPDILEWINLAGADLIDADLRRRALEVVIRSQNEDGCWRIAGVDPPQVASSFATLRALLALRIYREETGSPAP